MNSSYPQYVGVSHSNPGSGTLDKARLFSIDTFEGHDVVDIHDELDPFHKPSGFKETSYEAVKDYLSSFSHVTVLKGRFRDCCDVIRDKRFAFVHLDVDIYEPTLFALEFFQSRLWVGGCIIVDDYGFFTCPGVKKAVDEFSHSRNDFIDFYLLSGQYLLIKTFPEVAK